MKLNKPVSAGNSGDRVRSDCHITLEIKDKGGVDLNLKSKVGALYGEKITALIMDMLEHYEIRHARVDIQDSGALDFVIAARMEAVIRLLSDTDNEYLLPVLEENKNSTAKDRNRFSRLYLPGNTPQLMINAGIHKPDGIILDLEDAVAKDKKSEARYVVRNALRNVDFYGAERMVRINQLPDGLEDLEYVVPHNVNLILLPKCEYADDLHRVNEKIAEICKHKKVENNIWLMPIIESARGVVNVYDIADAADNLVAIAIGLEDFTADLGTRRTEEATESFFARSKLVIACRAAGIQAIDSVYSDVSDMEGLKQTVLRSKSLGFNGMGCIHPRQIEVIHEYYAPDEQEIEKAKKIYNAFLEAKEKGLGVVSLGTKMIDAPVVKRADNTIKLAIATGKLTKNWREEI